ncbi:DUF427 domain-containing protein [Thermoleophilia bacterium SCSIO 60948]|nr:DUF427 domain-containing protein [Thermoleophilia bacterium SCSIO 60948]
MAEREAADSGLAPNGRPYESVWDYPRPPALVACEPRVTIRFGGETVAESDRAWRVLETASPPTVYVPAADVRMDLLERSAAHGSLCEWKGRATYFDLVVGERRSEAAAWTYLEPTPRFRELAGALCFYPGRVDECLLGGEPVGPQPGRFYGGWMTAEIVGPVKGEPGTLGW